MLPYPQEPFTVYTFNGVTNLSLSAGGLPRRTVNPVFEHLLWPRQSGTAGHPNLKAAGKETFLWASGNSWTKWKTSQNWNKKNSPLIPENTRVPTKGMYKSLIGPPNLELQPPHVLGDGHWGDMRLREKPSLTWQNNQAITSRGVNAVGQESRRGHQLKREDVSDFHDYEVLGLSVLMKDISRCFVLMKQFTCHQPK